MSWLGEEFKRWLLNKRDMEWCLCGRRRVFVQHDNWFTEQFRGRWFWDGVPPHRFRAETDVSRIREFEKREKQEMEEADREWSGAVEDEFVGLAWVGGKK